jgi:hypothetical protein
MKERPARFGQKSRLRLKLSSWTTKQWRYTRRPNGQDSRPATLGTSRLPGSTTADVTRGGQKPFPCPAQENR